MEASEYFINKSAMQAKDIQQIIMGTGMGPEQVNSIMAQGKHHTRSFRRSRMMTDGF